MNIQILTALASLWRSQYCLLHALCPWPQFPSAGIKTMHPGASPSLTICYPHTSSMFSPTEGWCAQLEFVSGHHPCSQSAAHPLKRDCSFCVYIHVITPESGLIGSVSSCMAICVIHPLPRMSFEQSPGKPWGTGLGRLPEMCVQSCQIDLCPSGLYFQPSGP